MILSRKHLYLKISEDFLNMHLFYGGKSLKATFGTLKFIMTPGDTIEPRLVYFKNPDIKSDVGKATLANSITMTPGTITCDIDDDVFIVHAPLT